MNRLFAFSVLNHYRGITASESCRTNSSHLQGLLGPKNITFSCLTYLRNPARACVCSSSYQEGDTSIHTPTRITD